MAVENDKIEKDLTNPGQATIDWRGQAGLLRGILATLGLIAATHVLSSTAFYIPNVGAVTLLAVAYAAYTGGVKAGLVSAVISLVYTVAAFSIPGELFHFSQSDFHRMVVLLIISPAMAIMVGELRRRSKLYEELSIANAALEADMIERRKTEEKIRQERDFAESLLETTQAIVLVLDPAARIVRFNRYMEEVSGYRLDEVKGKEWFSMFLPESDRDRVRALFVGAINDTAKPGNVNPILTKNGALRQIEWFWKTLKDSNGKPVGLLCTGQDITERVALEQKSRELLYHQRALLDGIAEQAWLKDADGRYLAVNRNFADLVDLSPEQTIGKRATDIFPPDVARRYEAEDREVMLSGKISRTERVSVLDGGATWHEVIKAPVRNEDGRVVGIAVSARDITEQKKAVEALRESKERLRRSQAYANIGSWDWNIQTGELYWSERIGPLFGYAEGELKTTYANFLNAVHPEDRHYVVDSVNACVKDGAVYDIEHRIVWPDGTVRWVQERGDVIRGENRLPLRMLGVVQDITRRKQAEEALRESETRFRQLAENIREVFWISDVANDRILYVSPAYEHIWGRRLNDFDEAYGSFLESIHPEDRQQLFANMQAQRQGTGEEATEYRIVRPDGAVRWIRSRAFPIRDGAGKVYRIAGIAEDTTDVKHAEEDRLAHAVQQRDALVREVHHRIKNNLQAVAGLLMHEAHKHPELERLLTATMSQVQLIAVVHGIQANAANQGIFICEMTLAIAHIVESLTHSHFKVNVEIAMPCPAQISEKESVPVALILNELLINAVKHLSGNAKTKEVEIIIYRFRNSIQVIIFNQGSLPKGFNFDAGIGTGTGLKLVRSLMPRQGAELSFRGSSDGVEAVLKLGAPVIEV